MRQLIVGQRLILIDGSENTNGALLDQAFILCQVRCHIPAIRTAGALKWCGGSLRNLRHGPRRYQSSISLPPRENVNGLYFHKARPKRTKAAQTMATQKQLSEISVQITRLGAQWSVAQKIAVDFNDPADWRRRRV